MVAQHYRWDFYGLSTDSKPDATNPKVANGSTYYEADTSKLYVWYNDQWYEKESTGGGGELPIASAETLGGVKVGEGLSITEAGVLSASGGGSPVISREITEADYDYPESNPERLNLDNLLPGVYYMKGYQGLNFQYSGVGSTWSTPVTFIVMDEGIIHKTDGDSRIFYLDNMGNDQLIIRSADIANNLTTTSSTKVLSAKQGKELKDLIDALDQRVTALGG